MKKFYIVPVFVLLSLGFIFTASAQKRELTSDEVILMANDAERRLDGIAYKAVMTTEWFTERNGDLSIKDVYSLETLPTGRHHWTLEGQSGRVESIVVDGKNFHRVDDKPWELLAQPHTTNSPNKSGTGVPSVIPAFSTAGRVGKFVNRVTVNDQNVSVYEVKTKGTGRAADKTARTETVYYFIREDGLLASKIVEIDVIADKRFMQSVTNYFYGAEFRIDEPDISTDNN